MKNFKSFVQLDELLGVKPKAKKEHDFVHSTYLAQVKDPADLEKTGPEEIGPKDTKSGQGKRPADRLDNKQEFGEEQSHQAKTTMKHISKPTSGEKKAAKDIKPGVAGYRDRVAMLKSAQARGALKKEDVEQVDELKKSTLQSYYKKSAEDEVKKGYERSYHDGDTSDHAKAEKQRLDHEMEKRRAGQYSVTHRLGSKETNKMDKEMGHTVKVKPNQISPNKKKYSEETELDEADFTKQQTKMAHTIGKEFEKKGVGDESKGGPFAVASAMVRDKPEAAKKAYDTIKAKMKNEEHQDALMALYDELNETNQEVFMDQLENNPDKLLEFALNKYEV
jgi:hypothetical protein